MTAPRRRHLRALHADQDGLSAGAEALVFGVLVFVVGTIIVLNGWAVLDAKFAVGAAAREATRSIVEGGAVDRPAGLARATDVAAETLRGHGRDPADLADPGGFQLSLEDDPWAGGSGAPARCAAVTVLVRYPVRGIEVPFVTGWTDAISVTGQHTEIIDPFRGGLAGSADCG